MIPTIIRTSLSPGDYIPLAEHQAQTPATFFGGKPVLYCHVVGVKAWLPKAQRGRLPFFPVDPEVRPSGPGSSDGLDEQLVDVFVTSRSLDIFCSAAHVGLSIQYSSIGAHAIQTLNKEEDGLSPSDIDAAPRDGFPALYLQIDLSDNAENADEIIELTLVPLVPSTETPSLFGAVSACSNLNPSLVNEDNDDNCNDSLADDRIVFVGETLKNIDSGVFATDREMPPPMPRSFEWITAENVHEYFDEKGNWIGEREEGELGELGNGTRAVHARDNGVDEARTKGVDWHEEGASKRQKLDT